MLGTLRNRPLGSALVAVVALMMVTLAMVMLTSPVFTQEGPPQIIISPDAPSAVSIDENTIGLIGTYSAEVISTEDLEPQLTLTGEDADEFFFNEGDGSVTNKRGFDFENSDDKSLSFTFTATAGGVTATKDVTVTVRDKNDRPRFAADVFTCQVREQAVQGTSLPCNVRATDQDDATLTYSLSDSRRGGYFDIDPNTGAITVSEDGSGKLDFDDEENREFNLSVYVSDGEDIDGNSRNRTEVDDWATIRISVTEVTIEAPTLELRTNLDEYKAVYVFWSTPLSVAKQYRLQYRAVGKAEWQDHDLAAEGAIKQLAGLRRYYTRIAGLYADTEYEIQWRIGDTGSWIAGPNTVTTSAKANTPARITNSFSRPMTIAENADPNGASAYVTWGDIRGEEGEGDDLDQNDMQYWLECTDDHSEALNVPNIWPGPAVDDPDCPFDVELNGYSDARIKITESLDYESASSYKVTLRVSDGRNSNGAEDWTADDSHENFTISVTDVIEAPEPPVLRATVLSPTSVQLDWDTPADNTEPIVYYRVLYAEINADKMGRDLRKITGNSVVIENLTTGTTYKFQGVAVSRPYNSSGFSERGPIVTATVGTPSPTPTPEPTATPTPTPTPVPTATPTAKIGRASCRERV